MNRAAWLTCATAIMVMFCASAGVAAEVDWQVEVGFGQRYTQGAWTPLRVTLQNRGESRTGRITIPVKRDDYSPEIVYSVPVDLPQGAYKSYRLIVPRVDYGMPIKLHAGGDTEIQELQGANAAAPEDLLLVVLSSTEGVLGFLNGTSAPLTAGAGYEEYGATRSASTSEFVVAQSRWGALPQVWLGWDGADVAVVADSELGDAGEEELEALRLWVRLGGSLVVTGGARAPALADGRLGEMLPMDVSGTRTVQDLAALERWSDEPIGRQAALIADGSLREGAEVLLGNEAEPLVLAWEFGSGSVVMTTFDFAAEPVKYWDGQQDLWRRLIVEGQAGDLTEGELLTAASATQLYPWEPGGGLAGAAGQTREAALPPLWLVVGFLVAYIVVLVPVNYWFVNRLNRRELAWLTTPAIILLFFVAAYGTGFALRGHRTLLNRVAVLQVDPGQGTARGVGFAGIFSPAKTEYAMRLEGSAAAAVNTDVGAGERFTMEFGPQPTVRDIAVNMWSTRVIEVPFVAELGDGISGYFEWDGSDLRATVRNNTGKSLQSVGIVREGRIGRTTALAPGQEGEVDMIRATELETDDAGEMELGQRTLAHLFGEITRGYGYYSGSGGARAQPWIAAVHDEPLLPVDLIDTSARIEDAAVIVTRLPVRLTSGSAIHVPAWLVLGRIADSSGSVRQYEDYNGTVVTVNNGSVTWEFAVPLGAEGGTANSLEFTVYSDPSMGMPGMSPGMAPSSTPPATPGSYEVLNRQTGEWVKLTLSGAKATIPDPSQCMTEDGRVRVRLTAQSGEVTVRGVEMSGSVDAR